MTERNDGLVQTFLARADEVFGAGYSAVLYGSAARSDFLPGRSDLNLMLVAERLDPGLLRAIGPAMGQWERERLGPPQLITRAEWECASDVFPIEITDIRAGYQVLRGEDPIVGQQVRAVDLRRALEGELRGKLLRLRADYALYAGRPDLLAAVVGASVGSLRVLLRGVLALAGRPPAPDDQALAHAISRVCDCQAAPITELLAHRRDSAWQCPPSLFESYLAIVAQATHFVDHAHPGEY